MSSFNDPQNQNNSFHFKSNKYVNTLDQSNKLPNNNQRNAVVTRLGTLGVEQLPVIYLMNKTYINAFKSGITNKQSTPNNNLRPHTLKINN